MNVSLADFFVGEMAERLGQFSFSESELRAAQNAFGIGQTNRAERVEQNRKSVEGKIPRRENSSRIIEVDGRTMIAHDAYFHRSFNTFSFDALSHRRKV